MTRFHLSLLFLAVIMITGCKRYLILSYGIKQPKIENHASLKKALDKYDLPSDEVISARDSTIFHILASKGIGFPDAAFFDAKGYHIPYADDTVDCTGRITPFIFALSKGESYRVDSTFSISLLYKELVDARSHQPFVQVNPNGKADFYALFFWTVYSGKLSGKSLAEWHHAVIDVRRSDLNISTFYVNLDCQEFWGYRNEDLKKIRY